MAIIIEYLGIAFSMLLVIITFPISMCYCVRVVKEYERAILLRYGKVLGIPRGPGVVVILPCIDDFNCVDLRTVSFEVPPQEALTKDSVTVSVDAVVYYQIKDPLLAILKIFDYNESTRLLAMTTLRNVLGARNLTEILSDREATAQAILATLELATAPWGVQVERVEIKEVRLAQQLQRAMAAEAEATREARAKVLAAEGEMKASRALKEAAEVLVESPAALQLRYLQTLNTISAEKTSTVIFPLPIELFTPFINMKK